MKNHVNTVVGLTNPFSEQARGQKLPDDDSANSFTAQIRLYYTQTSNASSQGFVQVRPDPMNANLASFGVAAGALNTVATNTINPDAAAYINSAAEYRIVSFGVRVYNILPALTTQGTVRLITMNRSAQNGDVITSNLFSEIQEFPLYGLDVHWVSKPIGVEYKSYINDVSNHSWQMMGVFLDGVPASTEVLRLEVVYNIEAIPRFGSIPASISTPGLPSNPQQLAAASAVHSKHKNSHPSQSVWSVFEQLALGAVSTVANAAFPVLGGAVSRALTGGRQRYPMIVD